MLVISYQWQQFNIPICKTYTLLTFLFFNQMKPFINLDLQLLLLFILSSLWFQPNRAAPALGNETDYLALLRIKDSISNDPYNILSSWNSSSHFCSWHGITCSRRHQRVTKLNLAGYGLSGTISAHVGNLSFLRFLYVHNNSFHGQMPQQLGRLFRLQHLYVTNNTLTGEIPANLTGCNELRVLSLEGNSLSGQIPEGIGSLKKLEMFYATTNNLTGRIPASIGNLSSLNYISLAFNSLEGTLPDEIGRLENLTSIAVAVNKLSGAVPSSIYNLSSLIFISAGDNHFSGSLPTNMFLTLPNLQIFAIGENQISGIIPTSITNASALQVLDLSVNRLEGPIPSLGKLRDLQFLSLGNNNLGDSAKGCEFLESLVNCTNLGIMDITSNNFGGPLPNSMGNLSTQISQLYIGDNRISGEIPGALGNLINLIILGMENNFFTEIIPDTFGKFQNLQVLALRGNKLSGEIPTFIGNLSHLYELQLSQNMFEGYIPPSIGSCKFLQKLDLSQNNLSGAIPSDVIGLSSLSILLNLSKNSLNSSLPAEVGRLKNIGKLDISENNLSGDIPGTIGDCMSLEYLNLQGNSFHGSIPSSLASLKGLQHLDLSRNNLSGSIPKGLADISALEYLNVSFNMLDGEVPTKGVFQNASAVAVEGNNKLCGGISQLRLPPCPTEFVKKSNHHSFRLIYVIIPVLLFLLLLSSILAIHWVRKRNTPSSSGPPAEIGQLSKVSYQRLHQATNGFSTSNLIGSGSFGSVYKGSLESEEQFVAIKVLNLQKKGAQKSFIAECNALKRIRHRNLVKILTCCSSEDYKGHEFKALVFEYMKNGSLEKWLHPEIERVEQPKTLDLNQRLNAIVDIAAALHYLHYECELPIVHCDLKPSNVLLDNDMVAHVSDFGLARLLSTFNSTSHKQSSTIGIKGTIGYAPPEYGMGSEISSQGDTYSFGILMLELFTGKRPTDDMFKDGQNLHNYVKFAFPDNLVQILDPNLIPRGSENMAMANIAITVEANKSLIMMHPKDEKCLFSLFQIALKCSMESPRDRMNMADVTRELNLIRNAFLGGGISRE